MSYNPYGLAVRRALEDLEWKRRALGDIPDAVRQVQRDMESRWELRRQLEERGDIVRQIERSQEILRQLEERHSTVAALKQVQENLGQLERAYDVSSLSDVLYRNRDLVDSYVFDTFYGAGAASLGLFTGYGSFAENNEKFAESYEEVSEALESEEGQKVPQELRAQPTTEAFTSAEVVEELAVASTAETGEKDEEEDEQRQERRQLVQEIKGDAHQRLKPRLAALHPGLVNMWDGGLMAISSANPDKVRHFTSSLRELTREVLHRLAPDEEVLKWNSDPKLYHQGRPTRRARLQYICRLIDQPVYGGFVTINYKILLDTIELFHKGTHVIDAGYTQEQLDALEARVAQTLLFLLELGKKLN